MIDRKKKLRSDIIKKFESVIYFCKVAGYDHRNFYTFLNSNSVNEEMYQEARHKLNKIAVKHIEGQINQEDRDAIRICIAKINKYKPGSFTNFKKMHPRFDSNYLSNVTKGRLKNETPKYRALIKILKRDYNLKLKKHEFTKKV